jgi:hypothetical protein
MSRSQSHPNRRSRRGTQISHEYLDRLLSTNFVLSWSSVATDQFWGIGVSVASAGTSFLTAYVRPDPQVRTLSLLAGV